MANFSVKSWLSSLTGENEWGPAQAEQVTELQERIDALQAGNAFLKDDHDRIVKDWKVAEAGFEAQITQLKSGLAATETSLTANKNGLEAAQGELELYKTHYEKQNGKGKRLPIGDVQKPEAEFEGLDSVSRLAAKLMKGEAVKFVIE